MALQWRAAKRILATTEQIFPRKSATNSEFPCSKVCPVAFWGSHAYSYPVGYPGWVSESRKKFF